MYRVGWRRERMESSPLKHRKHRPWFPRLPLLPTRVRLRGNCRFSLVRKNRLVVRNVMGNPLRCRNRFFWPLPAPRTPWVAFMAIIIRWKSGLLPRRVRVNHRFQRWLLTRLFTLSLMLLIWKFWLPSRLIVLIVVFVRRRSKVRFTLLVSIMGRIFLITFPVTRLAGALVRIRKSRKFFLKLLGLLFTNRPLLPMVIPFSPRKNGRFSRNSCRLCCRNRLLSS